MNQKHPGVDILQSGRTHRKYLAWLIDPDKGASFSALDIELQAQIDFIFVGGSLLTSGDMETCISKIKEHTRCPVVIFPGHGSHICNKADGILLLSLVSGRNPELLIGQHVNAAMNLKQSGLQISPTAYLLIDGGKSSTVSYITQTQPIPSDKPEIAAVTALAGTQLGMKCVYLDAGSGAIKPVQTGTILAVRNHCDAFLVVGGGIRTPSDARKAWESGADCIVVGNAIEENQEFLLQLAEEKLLMQN
jgi:putative glycerol-1-phosphate prenyltransferase